MYIFSTILFVLCVAFPLFHIGNSYIASKKKPGYMKRALSNNEIGMSVLLPCYNEASILSTTIQGLMELNYSNYELIFINDGSKDNTFDVLKRELQLVKAELKLTGTLSHMPIKNTYRSTLYPNIIVIDKLNGGKADSLNAGISYATKEIVITLDADSILDLQALSILNGVFQDPKVISAGGNVHVLQGKHFSSKGVTPTLRNIKQIARFQTLEYLRGFYIFKASLSRSNALSIISGAFGAFKREVLLEVDGYRKTVGEDIDITLKVQRYIMEHKGLKVLFVPEAVCYTEVPESWKDLYNQRIRWQKAFMDCFVLYGWSFLKSLFKNRISFFFLVDSFLVGVIASYAFGLFVVSLLFVFNQIPPEVLVIFLGGSLFVNILYTVVSLKTATRYGFSYSKKDLVMLICTILLDLLVFRFINLFYIMVGSIAYFINKEGWNKVARTGRNYSVDKAA